MTDETISSDIQPLGEDSAGAEWTEMQEMLSVALEKIEDELFELTGAKRTHEAMAERNNLACRLVLGAIHKIPGDGIPVEENVIATCFMAIGVARRNIEKWENPQEAVNCLVSAGHALGIMEARKMLPSVAGRVAAHASHAEDRETAERIKAWYRENKQHYKSMDDAALAFTRIEPIAFRTARKHIGIEAKKLRSARKA